MNTTRRRILAATSTAALAAVPGLGFGALLTTPRQSRGPFYPLELPLDRDNDLVVVTGRPGMARGVHANVTGRVLDATGRPIRNALVEIWQCDAYGKYHHVGEHRRGVASDPNFQGYGQFETGADGAYRFRTIQPVPYPGRAPHIHFSVRTPGQGGLVTQMYVKGAVENARDFLLRHAGGEDGPLVVAFESNPDDSAERLARFDLVIG